MGPGATAACPVPAGVDLFVDGIFVAQCVEFADCWTHAPPNQVPWFFNFGAGHFSQLADGQAALTGQMTSSIQVYLGTLELDLTVNSPPILTVSGSGTGSGTIFSQAGLTPAINCTITAGVATGACQQTYPLGTFVTLGATGTGGSTFNAWSGSCAGAGCPLTMSEARAVSGAFTAPLAQTLTVSGAGTGNGTVTSQAGLVPAINCTITSGVASGACSQSYPWGTSVTLTRAVTGGSTFSGWSGACSGTGSTCIVSMTQARSVSAGFTAPPQTLTVSGAGTGSGTVTSQAGLTPAINCTITGGVASGACSQSYPFNTAVTLTAVATGGGSFSGWSGACSGTGTCGVTMSQARTTTATFTGPAQTLTVSGAGTGNGTVTSQAGLTPAINCTITGGVSSGACSQSYPFNTAVTLTATPTGGGSFSGWSGACSGTSTCGVTMSQARSATATFTGPAQTLTVLATGTGSGTVTSQAGLAPAINCTITNGVSSGACSQSYPFNTAVTLTAAATGGGTFSGWSGACSGTGTCGVTMSQARTTTATFTGPAQTLTVSGAGTGNGTVTSQAGLTPAINCTITGGVASGACSQSYPFNTAVTLTATATGGGTFGGWSGSCGGTGTCSLTMSQARSATATFTGPPQTLIVTGTGTGSGTVTSQAGLTPSINCTITAGVTSGTCSQSYPFNTVVTLTATPVGAAAFSEWSGACAGPGTCSVTMSQARNATAAFMLGTLTLTSLTPFRGTTAGGTAVDVTGLGFVSGSTTVTVGGVPASHVSVRSATRLSFVTPARPAGTAPVVVATPTATGSSSFTFVVPAVRRLTGARRPSFSFNGRYMAFESTVALVADDTNGVADVYVFDKVTDTLRRVSVSSAGAQALGGESQQAAISATGRFVAFESRATNLVPSDGNDLLDVFLHDRDVDNDGVFDEAGAIRTVRVSVATGGVEALRGFSRNPSISGNGRWVAFETAANNLVAGDTNGRIDICVHDRLLGRTVRISVSTGGAQALDGDSLRPAISLDGRYVAFDSAASNLLSDTNGQRDVFVHDRDIDGNGVMDEPGFIDTGRVSVSSSEAEATGGDSARASITQEGRFVAFDSTATNLVANDTNGERDVFLRDRLTGDTRRLSVAPGGGSLPGPSRDAHISANGAKLVFVTSGSNAGTTAPSSAAAIVAPVDDGKSTSGSIPSPTVPDPPPPVIDPVPPTGTVEDPNVSGDGSSSGTPIPPGIDAGGGEPEIVIERLPDDPGDPPFISGLGPASGPMIGGQVVEIQGGHFLVSDTVRWGGQTRIPLAGSTGSVLRVIAPPSGSADAVDVLVQHGSSSSNTVRYTYLVAQSTPVITSVTPASGPVTGQQSVTIQGTGFDAASVRFGAFAATITGSGPTSITVTTPPTIVAGPVAVIVSNTDGGLAVSDGSYTYLPVASGAPTITTVQPATGPAFGGTTLTILGSQFTRSGDGDRRRRGGDAGAVPEQLRARRHDVAVAGRFEHAVGRRARAAAGDRALRVPGPAGGRHRLRRRCRPGRRRHRRRLGGAVRPVGDRCQRRRGRLGPRRPHQRPGMPRSDASPRSVHAISRGGRDRVVLLDPRRPGQPRGDARPRPVPLPDSGRRDRAVRRHRSGGHAPHHRPRDAAGAGIGQRVDGRRVGRRRRHRSHDALGSGDARRRARRRQRGRAGAALVPGRGGDARVLRPVLLDPEPEPDRGGERPRPLPAPVRLTDRSLLHSAAEQPLHAGRRWHPGVGRH